MPGVAIRHPADRSSVILGSKGSRRGGVCGGWRSGAGPNRFEKYAKIENGWEGGSSPMGTVLRTQGATLVGGEKGITAQHVRARSFDWEKDRGRKGKRQKPHAKK